MDPECSICCSIFDSIENMKKIAQHIDFACQNKPQKCDFGLDKFFIERAISTLEQIQEWHAYYHATGKSLKDSRFSVDYMKPPIRRHRPG